MFATRGRAVTVVSLSLVAATFGGGVLAGCAHNPSAAPVTPTEAPTTAGPSLPVLTAPAKADTKDGAAAFTRYWFDLLTYGVATGDARQLTAVSDPQCSVCAGAAQRIQAAYGDGGSLQGGAYTLQNLDPFEDFAGTVITVAVTYDRSPRYGVSALGVNRGTLDGTSLAECDVSLRWTTAGWRVQSIQATDPLV